MCGIPRAVAGCIGLKPAAGPPSLVEGGVGPETTQTLSNIEAILRGCGSSLAALTKVNVYLDRNSPERFAEMNAAYVAYFGSRPVPPRITVGCAGLALGASVEMDAVAYAPPPSAL